MMADSGARGSISQIRQLAGMRGLIANTSGATIEMPIRSNYREGLNILEYFISSRGARKGLADTALRTADSGYLTRRLVDVSQDVIIREQDCGATDGLEIYEIRNGNELIEKLSERLVGRYLVDDLRDPQTGELIISKNKMLTEADAQKVVDCGVERIKIRSVLMCRARQGVCAKCYGANLAHGNLVSVGEAVGVIAAQSIGEPGTQLTMRTFHTGGIASAEDITQVCLVSRNCSRAVTRRTHPFCPASTAWYTSKRSRPHVPSSLPTMRPASRNLIRSTITSRSVFVKANTSRRVPA